MKIRSALFILFFAWVGQAGAGCSTSAPLTATHNIIVNENIVQSGEETYNGQVFYSQIKCTSTTDKIVFENIQSDWFEIGPFGNGQKLKVKIEPLTKSSETIGKQDNYQTSLPYALRVANGSNDFTSVRNNTYLLQDTIIANIGGDTSESIKFWLGICKSLKLNGCVSYLMSKLSGQTFSLGINLTYLPKNTTCKPEDLTITLPDVALSKLSVSGKINDNNAEKDIRLQCDNLVGDRKQASRKMVVYLSSSDLLPGSTSVIRGNVSNGVGFILENNNQIVNISSSAEQESATTLWKVAKPGEQITSNTIDIPVRASYYVYDKSKVKPGNLSATALIYVKYD